MMASMSGMKLFKSIKQDGFAVIPSVLSTSDVQTILDALDSEGDKRTKAGIRHAMTNPVVAKLARDEKLLQVARVILGSGAFPFRATLFNKSAKTNWLVAWHQDTSLPIEEKRDAKGWGPWSLKAGIQYARASSQALEHVLALRVHLDDSTAQNGPLRVLPGTHLLGVLTEDQVAFKAKEITSLECLAEKGSVVVMRPLLIHASSKAKNGASRRVLHIDYAACDEVGDGMRLAIP